MEGMRRCCRKFFAAVFVLLAWLSATPLHATSCTTQAALPPQERNALVAAGGRLAVAVANQDFAALQAALLPAVSADWDAIRQTAEAAGTLTKGGQMQLRSLYLLDASSLTAPADTQFFCSGASAALTVTLTMRMLPPGRYALVLADAAGAPMGGQLGLILVWDNAAWKLGGLLVRPGILSGHDGVWWWARARELVKTDPWSAWFCYETAKLLLVPVDFLSSPNLEKLAAEQAQIKNTPRDAFPLTLADGPRTWKIDSVRLDPALPYANLSVVYEPTGVTDPAAQRTEAVAVLSALLRMQPGLRENFYGLWAYAVKDGKENMIVELPMAQIP